MYTSAFDVYFSILQTINRENWNLSDTFLIVINPTPS